METLRVADNPFKGSSPSSKFLEQLHNKGYYSFYPNETWTPNVNLYETDATYMVCVDLAGVDKEKIEIEVNDGRLTLRGSRLVPSCQDVLDSEDCAATEAQPGRVRVHLMEIDHGSFARDVELPLDVKRDQINARYRNGMLWIELPKKD